MAEARDAQRPGEVAAEVYHPQLPRQVVLAVARRDYRHREHCRVAGLGAGVVPMPQRRHCLVNYHLRRHNEVVVHMPSRREPGP